MVFANRSSLIVLATSMRPSFIVLKFNIVSSTAKNGSELCCNLTEGDQFHASNMNFSGMRAGCVLHARYLLCSQFNNTADHQRGIVLHKIPCWGDTHAECIKRRRLSSRKTLPPFSLSRNILMSMRQMVSLEGVKTASYLTPTNAR